MLKILRLLQLLAGLSPLCASICRDERASEYGGRSESGTLNAGPREAALFALSSVPEAELSLQGVPELLRAVTVEDLLIKVRENNSLSQEIEKLLENQLLYLSRSQLLSLPEAALPAVLTSPNILYSETYLSELASKIGPQTLCTIVKSKSLSGDTIRELSNIYGRQCGKEELIEYMLALYSASDSYIDRLKKSINGTIEFDLIFLTQFNFLCLRLMMYQHMRTGGSPVVQDWIEAALSVLAEAGASDFDLLLLSMKTGCYAYFCMLLRPHELSENQLAVVFEAACRSSEPLFLRKLLSSVKLTFKTIQGVYLPSMPSKTFAALARCLSRTALPHFLLKAIAQNDYGKVKLFLGKMACMDISKLSGRILQRIPTSCCLELLQLILSHPHVSKEVMVSFAVPAHCFPEILQTDDLSRNGHRIILAASGQPSHAEAVMKYLRTLKKEPFELANDCLLIAFKASNEALAKMLVPYIVDLCASLGIQPRDIWKWDQFYPLGHSVLFKLVVRHLTIENDKQHALMEDYLVGRLLDLVYALNKGLGGRQLSIDEKLFWLEKEIEMWPVRDPAYFSEFIKDCLWLDSLNPASIGLVERTFLSLFFDSRHRLLGRPFKKLGTVAWECYAGEIFLRNFDACFGAELNNPVLAEARRAILGIDSARKVTLDELMKSEGTVYFPLSASNHAFAGSFRRLGTAGSMGVYTAYNSGTCSRLHPEHPSRHPLSEHMLLPAERLVDEILEADLDSKEMARRPFYPEDVERYWVSEEHVAGQRAGTCGVKKYWMVLRSILGPGLYMRFKTHLKLTELGKMYASLNLHGKIFLRGQIESQVLPVWKFALNHALFEADLSKQIERIRLSHPQEYQECKSMVEESTRK